MCRWDLKVLPTGRPELLLPPDAQHHPDERADSVATLFVEKVSGLVSYRQGKLVLQFPAGRELYLRRLAYLREWLLDFLVGVRLATTGSGPRVQSSEGTQAEGE